jgi:hypothetical protein
MRLLSVALVLSLTACTLDPSDLETNEDNLTQAGFSYTCVAPEANLLEKTRLTLDVTADHMRFNGVRGANYGARDRAYRASRGGQAVARIKYYDFEWGDDCTFKIIADESILRGAAKPSVRAQCGRDSQFTQEVYQCSNPKPMRMRVPKQAPAPPSQPSNPTPPVGTRAWSCTSSNAFSFDAHVIMQTDGASMRIAQREAGFVHDGIRDREFRSTSGTTMGFEDFETGEDCVMTAVVDSKVLVATHKSAALKLRCKGDTIETTTYACTSP